MEFKVGSCFDTYEEFEVAFNNFCQENKLNLVKTDCKTMDSYFRRYGGEVAHLMPLKFSRLVYSCSTRGFLHLKNSGRRHWCTASIRVSADKKLAQLRVKRIDKEHSPTCYHIQEPATADDERKMREMSKRRYKNQHFSGFGNDSNTSDSEGIGDTSLDISNRSSDRKHGAPSRNEDFNAHASSDSESDWDRERQALVASAQSDKQAMPSLGFPDDLPTMQNLSKLRANLIIDSYPRLQQQLPQQHNTRPKVRKIQNENQTSQNLTIHPKENSNSSSNTRENLISSSSNTTDVLNVTSQVFDWADTFFVSSICAEMNTLPKRVKNNLKLRIFDMVNKTVEKYEEKCENNSQNKQGASKMFERNENIKKVSRTQRKSRASRSANFPIDVRTKYQNGGGSFQNGNVPPGGNSSEENFTDITYANQNNNHREIGFENPDSENVAIVTIDCETDTAANLDQLIEDVAHSQSVQMRAEEDWTES